jgi:hypothetical protein
MRVTFTKVQAKRYEVAITRERGPALVPRFAPGYDDLMPHDVAHYLVEEYYGIELGVWGQLAAGGTGLFTPAPEDDSVRYQRRGRRIGAVGRADMQRSERLVGITVAAWQRGTGQVTHGTVPIPSDLDPALVGGAVRRMDEVARRWQALPYGGSLTFTWPARLTLDPSKSRRGRRAERRTPHAVRR